MSSLTQLVNGHRTASTRYPVPTTATHEGPGTGSSGVFHHPSRAASSSETVEQHQRSAAGRGKKGSVGQVNHTRKGKKRALTPLESVQGSSGGASEACGRPVGAGTSRSLEPCNPLSSKMPGGNEVEPATSCASANRPSNSTIREPRVRKGASKLHSWAESDPEVVDWAPAPAIKEKKADHDFRVPGQELRGGPSQHKSAFRYIVPFESHGAGSDAASNRRARATAFLAKFRGSPFVSPSSETAVSNQIAQSMSEVADSTNQAALSDPSSEHLGNSVSSSTDSSQSDSNSGRVCVSVRVPFGSRTRPDPSQPGPGTESSRSDRRQSKRSLRLDRRHIHSATTDAPFVLGDVPVRSKRMRIEPQPLAATRHSSSGSQGVSEPTRTQGMLETQGGQEMDRVQTAEETYTAPHANQSQDVNRRGNFQEEMTNGSQQMIESQSQGRDSINPNSSPDVTTSLSSDSLHAVPLTVPTQPTTTAGGFQLVPTMSSSHAFSLSLEISGGSGGNTIDLSLDVSGMEVQNNVLYMCVYIHVYMYNYILVYICLECRSESHLRQLIFLRKSDCLWCAVLHCLVCLFDLACFFLPYFSSLIKTCIYMYMYVQYMLLLYLKSVPIHVIVHVYMYVYTYTCTLYMDSQYTGRDCFYLSRFSSTLITLHLCMDRVPPQSLLITTTLLRPSPFLQPPSLLLPPPSPCSPTFPLSPPSTTLRSLGPVLGPVDWEAVRRKSSSWTAVTM